ncbi:MAG: bifunctional ADP-dependent NAD(P)H-hydrate dehydratase/NAD(P)H-hydrate epimerase, partial [Lysobacterales bacterium CG_4_9_14_3_um_filter_62_6]
ASAAVIAAINASGCPVLAIDLPSGLNADTGAAPGACVRATVTLCLIAWKRGLFTGVGPECAGKRLLENLAGALGAAPRVDWDQGQCQLLSPLQIATALPRRPRDAHKGRFGHALILGGDQGIGGAALLAAEAALRSGAGRVSVATHPD